MLKDNRSKYIISTHPPVPPPQIYYGRGNNNNVDRPDDLIDVQAEAGLSKSDLSRTRLVNKVTTVLLSQLDCTYKFDPIIQMA